MAHSYSSKERTSDVLNEENVNIDFGSLLLSRAVLTGLSQAGFERPSPIQLKAIPLGRCGLDMIVQAKSGTGKTCVFSVIILESLDLQCAGVQALVLTPTREIATQVQGVIQSIGRAMQGLRCHTFIGGTLFGPDRQKLKKCHIAVGTPGRVKQLIEYDVMRTESIRLLILDEADKLLDDKFQDQINWIYNHLPVNKQMLALSATYPEALAKGLTSYMRDPTFVRLNPRKVALKGIKQFYKVVPSHGLYHKAFEVKVEHLLQLLTRVSFSQCLVFSNLSSRAQNLSDILCDRGWPSTCISGNQDQVQRHSAMSMLKTFKCRVLISTDLTARGIDAENVNLIVNLDVPSDGKTYMHRIGRAGRFGSKGVAVTFASEGNEETLLRNIQKQCHVSLQLLPDPVPSDLVNSISVDRSCIDTEEESTSGFECDSDSQDNPDIDAEIGMEELQCVSGAREASDKVVKEPPLTNKTAVTSHRNRDQRSNSWLEVNKQGDSVLNAACTGVSDKSCQVDTLGMPLKMDGVIDFKIPSLAEKFSPRREDEMWTWEKAAKDFVEFMSGCSESVDMQLGGLLDTVKDETAEEPVCFAGSGALKNESEDEQRTASEVKDLSCSVEEMFVHRMNGEEINELDRLAVDDVLRSQTRDQIISISDFGHDSVGKSDDFEARDETLSQNGTKEADKGEATDPCISLTTVSDEKQNDTEETEKGKDKRADVHDSGKKVEACAEPDKGYKVAFSWRPSQAFFSGLVTEEMTRLHITETRRSDDDDTYPESMNPPADSYAVGTMSNISLTALGSDSAKLDNVGRSEARKLASERSERRTQVERRPSKASPGVTESKQPGEVTLTSEESKFQCRASGKPSSAPPLHHANQRNAKEVMPDWQEPEANSSSTHGQQQTDASVSNSHPSRKTCPPGEDPIWQAYTTYLSNLEDAQSDADSCSETDDSITESIGTSDCQESSDGSESGPAAPSGSQNSQEWKSKPETTAHYGWLPTPYDPSAYSSWYRVPNFTSSATTNFPNPTDQENPLHYGPSDYHESPYSGQYAYWPYAYY
ncbi:uncharacterized protein LOC110974182 [Acanthaster planci]|uniref:RNA helicase n=1 Tax=Acanthaster planci TaxID=133434 RepID=A0A8B7XMK4_ACAPL|nr:uncharacterized protein LOC110974182 [Acanthaster planci]